MDTLTVALASLGGVVLAGVIAHGAWQARRAGPKQASDSREEPSASAPVRGDEPGLDDDGAVPADDPTEVAPRRLSKRVPLQLDALIDAFATFTLDGPVSAEAIAPHLAAKRFVGSKLFLVEGLNSETERWEAPAAGQRYAELQAGVQLASRTGALNEIEYSEFVQRMQTFAEAIGAGMDPPDRLDASWRRKWSAVQRPVPAFEEPVPWPKHYRGPFPAPCSFKMALPWE